MTTSMIKTLEPIDGTVTVDSTVCGICRRQISRYTCPSCNLSYCGLQCFRSESHSRCSETFYRKEIEGGIKSDTSKTQNDRIKMLELLRKIEEQSSANEEDELFRSSDEENEEGSLTNRFSAIDIASASTDDILRLLTEKERQKFFVALKDPSGELTRELLESAELDETRQLPWWEARGNATRSSLSLRIPYGTQPSLMAVPIELISQSPRGVSLLYNIISVLLAYTYVTRHLAISPLSCTTTDPRDRREAREIISQSVSFLIDRKSNLLYASLNNAVISFWSRLNPGSIDGKTMLVLLEDVAKIVRPLRLTVAEHSSGGPERTAVVAADHPFATTIMAISDISSLFNDHVDSSATVRGRSHIHMKLTFYAAHILSTPPSRLHSLADELLFLSKSVG